MKIRELPSGRINLDRLLRVSSNSIVTVSFLFLLVEEGAEETLGMLEKRLDEAGIGSTGGTGSTGKISVILIES